MKATLKEIIRRNVALHTGAARPGRVTQLVPNGKGGFARRAIDPEAFRQSQAADYAAGVAAAREKLGLSQREMAALLGISPRTLENWEQGHREPSQAAKMLIRVALRHPRAVLEAMEPALAVAEPMTVGAMAAWEERNFGNKRLYVRRLAAR